MEKQLVIARQLEWHGSTGYHIKHMKAKEIIESFCKDNYSLKLEITDQGR